jgi:hypothetical protein
VNDRHRWVLSFKDARHFCPVRAPVEGFELSNERALVGPRRGFGPAKWLIAKFPNLLAPTYVAFCEEVYPETVTTTSRRPHILAALHLFLPEAHRFVSRYEFNPYAVPSLLCKDDPSGGTP